MTFDDGKIFTLNLTDDLGLGDLEPDADMKWTDGASNVYVWHMAAGIDFV